MPKATDISQEFMICRYSNGIQLLPPEYLTSHPSESSSRGPVPIKSVGEIMQMPFSVFFFEKDFKVKDFNDVCCAVHGIYSKSDVVGDTVAKISNNQQDIDKLYVNNNQVMDRNQLSINKENLGLLNDRSIQTVSFKMPWYSEKGDMAGIFGCAVIIHQDILDGIAKHFISISNMFCPFEMSTEDLLNGRKINGQYFSPREVGIIHCLLHGKTLREMGLMLKITSKSIERFLENIKIKMGVKTKSELIERVIGDIFLGETA